MLRPCVPSDQIVLAGMDDDVVDADRRQALHEALPRLARHRATRRRAYSVPRNSRFLLRGSSVITLTLPSGRLPAIEVHVSPKSRVTNTYGFMSSVR